MSVRSSVSGSTDPKPFLPEIFGRVSDPAHYIDGLELHRGRLLALRKVGLGVRNDQSYRELHDITESLIRDTMSALAPHAHLKFEAQVRIAPDGPPPVATLEDRRMAVLTVLDAFLDGQDQARVRELECPFDDALSAVRVSLQSVKEHTERSARPPAQSLSRQVFWGPSYAQPGYAQCESPADIERGRANAIAELNRLRERATDSSLPDRCIAVYGAACDHGCALLTHCKEGQARPKYPHEAQAAWRNFNFARAEFVVSLRSAFGDGVIQEAFDKTLPLLNSIAAKCHHLGEY